MSRHIFEWKEDREGQTGWVLRGMPHFDVTQPRSFSHDCLEHMPGAMKYGAIADEMIALGARLYLRVATSFWAEHEDFGEPESVWADEFMYQLEYIFGDGTPQPPAPRKVRVLPPELSELEDIIATAASLGTAAHNDNSYGNDSEYTVDSKGELVTNMANWMRIGVLAAMKRYNGCNEYVCWRGETLDKAVEKLRGGEYGDQLIVTVHESNLEIGLVHITGPEWSRGSVVIL